MHFILAFLLASGPALDVSAFFDEADALLEAHVADGLVDYATLQAEPAGLDALVENIATLDWTTLPERDQKAYLINAYNLLVLKAVVDAYPFDSPLKVRGFFDGTTHTVAGQALTLNALEKDLLFANFPDARLHFALVCAAKGCPVLIPEAYRGKVLNRQLDRQTRIALNTPMHVEPRDGNELVLSELFKWYAADFERAEGSVVGYINAYRDTPVSEKARITYRPYDWALNDK